MKNNAVMFSGKRTFVLGGIFFSFITTAVLYKEKGAAIYERDEKVSAAAKTTDVRDKMF